MNMESLSSFEMSIHCKDSSARKYSYSSTGSNTTVHDSTEDLKTFIQAQLDRFDMEMDAVISDSPASLKPSPNLQNIHEIYQHGSTATSITSSPRMLYHDITGDTICEVPEEEENNLEMESASLIAKQIYNLQYKKIPIEEYAQFLGTNDDQHYTICEEFMKLFGKWPADLTTAVRNLCSKLYLVAESTQIDQILEVFAQSWVQRHPGNPIGDYKAVHIVCFSIFILNSDLHNDANQENKFTRDEFVENTLQAIKEEKDITITDDSTIGSSLKSYYDSINNEQLQIISVINAKIRQQRGKRVMTPPKVDVTNVSMVSKKNNKRLSSIGNTLSASPSVRRVSSFSDRTEVNYDVDYKKDAYDERLEQLGPPWTIEGLMKCERTQPIRKKKSSWFARLTNSSQIPEELDIYNANDWKQSIVVVAKGLLKQYSFDSIADRKNFMSTKQEKYVNTVLTYNLYSATARLADDNMITNSSSSGNGVPWVLTIPNLLTNDYTQDKQIVYYAPNEKVANNFVETCNFWAARITSIPSTQDDIVTNQEYGWSGEVLRGDKHLNSTIIQEWKCLLSVESSFIPSALVLDDQFSHMKKYVDALHQSITAHNELKEQLEKIWGRNRALREQNEKVMSNWYEKYVYLIKQQQKYETYVDSLAFALSFKASKL